MPHPENIPRTDYTVADGYYVVPGDLATIYNFNPVFAKGYLGTGADDRSRRGHRRFLNHGLEHVSQHAGSFGLYGGDHSRKFTRLSPSGTNNCSDPGVNTDDGGSDHWTRSGQPRRRRAQRSCRRPAQTQQNFGGFIALQNLLNESGTPPAIVSISYGASGARARRLGKFLHLPLLYEQAAAEGVSIFVSSGDEGAASSDADASYATHGSNRQPDTPRLPTTCPVGGTDFGDTFSGRTISTGIRQIHPRMRRRNRTSPEIPWNDSCASELPFQLYWEILRTYGTAGFCNSTTGKK